MNDGLTPESGLSPAARLGAMLGAPRITRVIGAHSPLSARLGEEAGFHAIWASGLEISAAAGVPDANILSMTETLSAAAGMADAVAVPVLADCDSGYGNVNNVVHMVRSYEQRGIAGVCIEDKQYPKLNSFAEGSQDLAPAEDFAAKLRAAVTTRNELVVVARLEALIAGQGMNEALRRAELYETTGADALLIHSKKRDPGEVFAFRERYDGDLPVIVVPTTYQQVTALELQERGFAMAIYANHALRSSVHAMQETLNRIMEDGTTHFVEGSIATVSEVFRLQGLADMLRDQQKFETDGRALTEMSAR